MHSNSLGKAAAATIACGGLILAAGAAASAPPQYRDLLIVAGIDALVIGAAAFLLIVILGERAAPRVNLTPGMRSLENSEGAELKKMLLRHVAADKPVTIGFPVDDAEAEQFAGQIGRFLHETGFSVTGFAAAPSDMRLDPGVGIDDDNNILVGPLGSRLHSAPSAEPVTRAETSEACQRPAEGRQASRLVSP